jgi:hypothetical protein
MILEKREKGAEMYHVRACGRLTVVEGREGDYVAGWMCGLKANSGSRYQGDSLSLSLFRPRVSRLSLTLTDLDPTASIE